MKPLEEYKKLEVTLTCDSLVDYEKELTPVQYTELLEILENMEE